MNIIYKNIEDDGNFYNEPLTYRLTIEEDNGNILIIREYFRVGYKTGEKIDEFFRDNFLMHPMVSIITRKFNEKYLNDLENKIYDVYISYLTEINNNLNNNKQKYMNEIDRKISKNNNILEYISSKNRKEKIIKILNDK